MKAAMLLLMSLPLAAQEHPNMVTQTVDALRQQRLSISAQRTSVKRQLGEKQYRAILATSSDGSIPPVLPIFPVCGSLNLEQVEGLIGSAALKHDLDRDLLRAVMHQESNFRPCAVSPKGALGLMQLMPATVEQFQVSDPFDPAQNVEAGSKLLRELLDHFRGDLNLTLAAYNSGSQTVQRLPPEAYPAETKAYIAAISSELGSKNPELVDSRKLK